MNSEQHSFLPAYQHLLTISQQMLMLAQQAQWEELLIVEQDYRQAVGQLTALGAIAGLPEPLQQKLTNMLQTILRDEREIRQLMHSRVNQLATFIRQTVQQQQLQCYYNLVEQ